MKRIRGGTGLKRGDVYGGNISTRPASVPNNRGAVSLGALVPRLTKQVFEKYGFSTAQLIADWPAIVGPQLAQTTRPEKLKWPHKSNSPLLDENFHQEVKGKQRGATLVVRVDGPHSLELQFGSSQIMERINSFFGYAAVTDLRIIQAPVGNRKEVNLIKTPVDASDLTGNLSGIKNEALKKALERMAVGVKTRAINKKLNSK